jgi:uncharacterized protein DUF3300
MTVRVYPLSLGGRRLARFFPEAVKGTTMNPTSTQVNRYWRKALAMLCAVAIGSMPTTASAQDAAPVPADQLDSLVAPIALYPDPLLAQTLAASTYPLEIMQLQQWLAKNAALKDKALADAVAQQPWDPSVQSMAAVPDVVKQLADNIQWTTDLGNAFLAQQGDVMKAVQRMRAKAQGTGNLKSTEHQAVETRVVEDEHVIVIEQASPQVVYVPSYDPLLVYGPPVYPYPPISYPAPGYYAAGMAVSFGVGVAMGAFWGSGGGWGWGPRWGNNDITINNNNNFVRNANVRTGYRGGTVSNTWQHNAAHRGGAPYRDRATANRYGGTARGDSLANRQAGARQQISRQGGNLPSSRAAGTSGFGDRQATGSLGTRSGSGSVGSRAAGQAGQRDFSPGGGAARSGSGTGQLSTRDFSRAAGGADRIGQRDLSRSGTSGSSAFNGGSRYDGGSARASSSRGASSVQSRSRSSSGSSNFGGGSRSRSGGGSRSSGGFSGSRGGGGRRR